VDALLSDSFNLQPSYSLQAAVAAVTKPVEPFPVLPEPDLARLTPLVVEYEAKCRRVGLSTSLLLTEHPNDSYDSYITASRRKRGYSRRIKPYCGGA
jgi:hypothetical protein